MMQIWCFVETFGNAIKSGSDLIRLGHLQNRDGIARVVSGLRVCPDPLVAEIQSSRIDPIGGRAGLDHRTTRSDVLKLEIRVPTRVATDHLSGISKA